MSHLITGLTAQLYEHPSSPSVWDVRFSWRIDSRQFSAEPRHCRLVAATSPAALYAGKYDVLNARLGPITNFYFQAASIPRPKQTALVHWQIGTLNSDGAWNWSEPASLVLTPQAATLSRLPWIGLNSTARPDQPAAATVFDLRATLTLARLEFTPVMPVHFRIELRRTLDDPAPILLADFASSPCLIRGVKWAAKIETKSAQGRYLVFSDIRVPPGSLNGVPFEILITVEGRRGSLVLVIPEKNVSEQPLPTEKQSAEESPNVLVRKSLHLDGPIRQAVCTYTGLGYCYFLINGSAVTPDLLWPPFTNYRHRVYCRSLDVTALLKSGDNVLAASLGNAFRDLPTPDIFGHQRCEWNAPPAFACELVVTFANGRTRRWQTDRTWFARPGAYRFNCLRGGETIDAGIDEQALLANGGTAAGWRPCRIVAGPEGRLLPDASLPILGQATLVPQRIENNSHGGLTVDFGKTMTGTVQFKATGRKGQRLLVRSNDMLLKDGTVDIGNCSMFTYGRFQTDVAVLSGKNADSFEPRFSYKGFRYAEFVGDTAVIETKSIQATSVTNELRSAGWQQFSHPTLAKLHDACVNTLASSLHGIPDDSTREKMGWLGENGLHSYSQFLNFDAHRIYRKWIFDILDTQNADGLVSNMAPECGFWHRTPVGAPPPSHNDPWWCGSFIIVAWNLYLFYEDRDILKTIFPAATRLMRYISRHSDGGIVEWNLGDWLELDSKNFPQRSPIGTVCTLGFKLLADRMGDIATVLGKQSAANQYRRLSSDIVAAFRRRFGRITRDSALNSQATWALMLELNIPLPSQRRAVLSLLERNVEREYGGHLSTGSIGTLPTLRALADHGHDTLISRLLVQKEYPGFGHMIAQGATALWENWNGLESQCHVTYVGVHEFMQGAFGALQPRWHPAIGRYLLLAPGRARSLGHNGLEQRQPLFSADADWTATKRSLRGRLAWQADVPVLFDSARCLRRGEHFKLQIHGGRRPATDITGFLRLPGTGAGELVIEKGR